MSFQIHSPTASPWGTPTDERPRPKRQSSAFRPAVAPSPGGYQQSTSTPDSYFPPQTSSVATSTPGTPLAGAPSPQSFGMGSLAQQAETLAINDSASILQQSNARRKKDRHAYHQLEQTGAQDPKVLSTTGQQPPPAYMGPPNGVPTAMSSPGLSSATWRQWNPPVTPRMQQWQSPQVTPSLKNGQSPVQNGTQISMGAQGAPQGQTGSSAQSRVNPDQVPSIPLSRDVPAGYYKTHLYPTMEQHLPPPAAVPYVAYDQGNCSPKHARLTLNCIPHSQEQLAATALPLGLIMQPLARQSDGEQEIPVLDFGDVGPPRCRRCRAYVNPFMVFSNGGNRMTCNLCSHASEVGPEYFAPVDPSGVRVDRLQRPELLLGTSDFVVPKEYWSKEPLPIRYLFLIDVSAEACARGFLQAFCDGIQIALFGHGKTDSTDDADKNADPPTSRLPPGARVGFMTIDREISFYDVSPSLAAPQQLVIPDLGDPFAPMSSDRLFVDPALSKSNICALLQRIPAIHLGLKRGELALLPSLAAASLALGASGGKIVCSLASLPNYGPDRLQPRDQGQSSNDDGDHTKDLLKTDNAAFRKCQAEMVKAGIGVDFFLAAPIGGYLDIATIGFIAEKTGGDSFYYPNWSYPRDDLRLQKEISHVLQRDQGYAALMKVRCSNGLQVAHYSGSFTQHTFGADLELASVTQDSAMSVTFTYDGKLDTKLDAHFQSALLYTTVTGQRRVRCSNIVASVTETARDSMRFVDQDAVVCVMAKESAAKIGERTLKEIRQALQDKTINILAGYRKNFSGSHPPGQLVLPENLKEFSMYMLGLLKSRALKAGREPNDRRVHESRLIKSMGPAELSLYLYPNIIALHTLDPSEGFADENGHLKMPQGVRASFSQLEEGGAYLVDNGQILLLWLHQQVSPNLVEDLFGEGQNSLPGLDPNLSALPVLESHLNAQVRNILLHLEAQRGSKGLAIQLARQGLDGAEFEFARLLFEDRNSEASSYVDWLVMLHRGIGMELNGQRPKSSDDISHTISNTISSITGNVPYWG